MRETILVFDYDGTLHETFRVYRPGIEEAVNWLRSVHGVDVNMPPDSAVRSWLGMSTAQMWEDFLPQLPDALKAQAGALVGSVMRREILAGHGKWYPGVTKKLDELKAKGYRMAVLSNCDPAYARLNREAFGMDRWFEAFYDCETYAPASKADAMEIVARLLTAQTQDLNNGQGLQDPVGFVVIGDRGNDREAARRIGARFVFCEYGYGTREEVGPDAEGIKEICDLTV